MININYTRLFNLVVGHGYFKDGHDRFIILTPTGETKSLLKNGKMLFKNLPHGVTVLYRAEDDEVTPFVDLGTNQHLVFKIEINDINSFLNITDLDESLSRRYQSRNIIYLTNDPAQASSNKNSPQVLNSEILDTLRNQLFTFTYSIDSSPATTFLTVTDRSDIAVSVGTDTEGDPLPLTLPVTLQSNGEYSRQIDLRDKPKGKYTITIANSDGSVTYKTEEIYADNQLENKNILGIVDLEYNDDNELYGDTEEYKILFNRLNTTWKYFIVNKSANLDFSSESVAISDAGTANGTPYITNVFSRAYASILLTADSIGPDGNEITLSYSGGGNPPAVILSGKTLSGGTDTDAATAVITIINNDIEDFTISIDGVDFTEGVEFSAGTTATATASNLITAIEGEGSVTVGAETMDYDVLINDLQTVVFESDERIPFFETPKLKIELLKEPGPERIVPHLSNPSPSGNKKEYDDKLESEIYVFI